MKLDFVALHQPKVNDHISHILYRMTHGTEVTTCEHPQHCDPEAE